MDHFRFSLYVTGFSVRIEQALENFRRACDQRLKDRYELVIVDVLEHPEVAEAEKVLATPTLIKELPLPMRRVTGDLTDAARVLDVLGVASSVPHGDNR